MDLFNKFSKGLSESSTPKSSIYYSEEADIATTRKDAEVEIGLKNQESYYQRQLREQLSRSNMLATNIPSMKPVTPLQPTIHITNPQPIITPTLAPVPLPKPRQQVNTNTSTSSASNAELIDWLSISNKMQNDTSSSSCSQTQPSSTIQSILDKFNKDQNTTTPSSTQPPATLLPSTTTCTQQSDGSISCSKTPVPPPPPLPIVATVCTPTPTGGTVCTTAQPSSSAVSTQQNPSGASAQQNLDNVPLSDLMRDVEKDMLQLQKESDDLVTDVNDAREYTRRAIDQILKLVKGLERFQK
ncbi:39kDa virion core protein [Volepox virus]|uniref:39kDa core protein OPG130 n=1 Tax=Volepox virus TaxID=28874 RepID=A0A1C9KCC5_9POXV|nr:39kDa virion core protein [Volepox virus]AOP31812.1 39kDa virion core protein [Volepox virus]